MNSNPINVSVILCTYNRASLLRKALQSLSELESTHIDWELLVVDNNSTDATSSIIKSFKNVLPILPLFEAQQGKCHALNLAISRAQGSVLVFLDDDIEVPTNWLNSFVNAAQAGLADWYGSRVKPDWHQPPSWFNSETANNFDGYFGNYDLGQENHPYAKGDKLPLGASMACHRHVFDAVGNFRTDLGPRGNLRGVGDETDLLMRAIEHGFIGFYLGQTTVKHHVGNERIRLSGFINYGIGKGINHARMENSSAHNSSFITRVVSQAVRGILQLLGGRGDRFRICLINIGIELGRRRA